MLTFHKFGLLLGVPFFLLAEEIDTLHPTSFYPAEPFIEDCVYQYDAVYSTLTLRHIESESFGYNRGYTTTAGLFFPNPNPCKTIWPFLDLRVHFFNDNEWAANGGMGVRFQPCWSCCTFGANVYMDYRASNRRGFHFTQTGLGFEVLCGCFDFRLNGYVPIHAREVLQRCYFDYPGGFYIKRNKYKGAMRGLDAEVGLYLFRTCDFSLYAGAGPYLFGGSVCDKPFGGAFRAVFEYTRNLSLEGIVTWDNTFGVRVQGQFGIHFTFGCVPCRGICEDILSQPVNRQEIIVLDEFCKWRYNY